MEATDHLPTKPNKAPPRVFPGRDIGPHGTRYALSKSLNNVAASLPGRHVVHSWGTSVASHSRDGSEPESGRKLPSIWASHAHQQHLIFATIFRNLNTISSNTRLGSQAWVFVALYASFPAAVRGAIEDGVLFMTVLMILSGERTRTNRLGKCLVATTSAVRDFDRVISA